MDSFTGLFGKQQPRNSPSSNVRTRFHRERGSTRGRLTFVFPDELLGMMGWKAGDLLELQGDGERLVVVRSPTGRTVRRDRCVEWAIDDNRLSEAKEKFGFDVTRPQFWEKYNPDRTQVVL